MINNLDVNAIDEEFYICEDRFHEFIEKVEKELEGKKRKENLKQASREMTMCVLDFLTFRSRKWT